MSLVGPYLVACFVLVLAGVMKAIRPGDSARAVQALVPALSFGAWSLGIRMLAAAEAALGVVALLFAGPVPAGAVAASYLGFSLVVVYARTRGGAIASCGCFGTPDTPATWLHVVINLILAASAAAVAVAGPKSGLLGEFVGQPLHGVPILGSALLGTWLVFLALGPAARLAVARTEDGRRAESVRVVVGARRAYPHAAGGGR